MNISAKEIKHIEDLLIKTGCSKANVTPYAMQIIRDVKINGGNVFEVEISN